MRLVIKVGTSLLTDEKGELNRNFIHHFVAQIAGLRKEGHELVIVSSGAVAAGRSEISFEREKKNIPFRQVLAACGQGILMKTYYDFFKKHAISVAQALLTNFDFVNRENFLNTKNVFELLLSKKVIPIVNENDVTTIAELKFGDNDMLSAKTAAMISADLLVIFTDVEGLFSGNPRYDKKAQFIPVVPKVDEKVFSYAKGAASERSKGGMITKLQAAKYATGAGVDVLITKGADPGLLQKIIAWVAETRGNPPAGTFFPAAEIKTSTSKRFLQPKIKKNSWIEVDEGAHTALKNGGKSLLPSGIIKIHGDFKRGDVVSVKGPRGEFGFGQVNYDAVDLDKIKRKKSSSIEEVLGFSFEQEAIHRDRMVLLG